MLNLFLRAWNIQRIKDGLTCEFTIYPKQNTKPNVPGSYNMRQHFKKKKLFSYLVIKNKIKNMRHYAPTVYTKYYRSRNGN